MRGPQAFSDSINPAPGENDHASGKLLRQPRRQGYPPLTRVLRAARFPPRGWRCRPELADPSERGLYHRTVPGDVREEHLDIQPGMGPCLQRPGGFRRRPGHPEVAQESRPPPAYPGRRVVNGPREPSPARSGWEPDPHRSTRAKPPAMSLGVESGVARFDPIN